ncbi:MAG TPA: hypothetical protein VJQ59_01370 [Candidatus Sulfotelmatobacter sp.]|nr:hypothetical protein [Candidatus Sulfotelmatobacter sp.]
MKLTRRDLLAWSAGAAAGLMVTPVPWKILDDTSIWSQNWPWIPQPARVPVEVSQSHCTLCPKGCGVRVRMAAGWAVGISGMKTHPINRGTLCPLGFGAHQLNWHPQRMREVRHSGNVSSWSEAQAAFASAKNEGPVVIIDGHPGRAASAVFERSTEKSRGEYRVVPCVESRGLAPYEQWTGAPAASFGYDLENTQTIVSFGTPLLDGWGTPGYLTRLWAEKSSGADDPQLRIIQIEPTLSRTAARAWKWMPIRDGSESALASGLARVLLEQNLVPAHGPIPAITIAETAIRTGLSEDAIRNLARTLVERRPTVAIAPNENPTVAALNIVLGSVGIRGGIIRRETTSHPYSSAHGVISNARAVLIDSSVPWDFVPQTDAEIFRFAAWNGGPTKADWLLPATGFLEELTDVPAAPALPIEAYSVAPALLKPTSEVKSAAHFLVGIDSSLTPTEKIIHDRCVDLFSKRAGTLHGQESIAISKIESIQKLKEQLWKGAVWVGEPSAPGGVKCELKEWPEETTSAAASGWSSSWDAPVLPPLASKLYIESSLREAPQRRNA